MNRLQELFERKNERILSIYFTAGYPKLEDTKEIIVALDHAGVDMLEIGMPFSDPMADGLTIQESNKVALDNGMSLSILFAQLAGIRTCTQLPLLLMGYLNPIIQYGFERFCAEARKCGIDALIIPDIPLQEYIDTYREVLNTYGLKLIFLITPQTTKDRILLIDSISNGFIYLVTTSSLTGKRSGFTETQLEYLKKVRDMNLSNPILAGFGISTGDDFTMVSNFAHGGIIGSSFISMLKNTERSIDEAIPEFVNHIKL
jgi:tryptophan synthase alpha chain